MALIYQKLQDIHNTDRDLWETFYKNCNNGKYDEATDLVLDDANNLKYKAFRANPFYVASVANLTYLQKLDDPTFKQDKIQVLTTPPTNITAGQIYFKIEEEEK